MLSPAASTLARQALLSRARGPTHDYMMKLSLLCLSALLAGGLVQDRAKKTEPADLPKVLANATKAFEAKQYGSCQRELKVALGLVARLVRGQILAAMPPAPEGFTAVEDKADAGDASNAIVQAMGMTSVPTERVYRKDKGREEIKITVMADSPMAAMMGMAFNVAAMSKEGEVITYKENKGLLKKSGDRYELQILVAGKHLIQVEARGIDDDGLLKMVDQAFVDRLVTALDG